MSRRSECLVLSLGLVMGARAAPAQTAETLYGAGAYRAAADSFSARGAANPDVPAHWYNLGAALYRLGDETGARAAWIRAGRALPRNSEVRQVVGMVEAPDAGSAAATKVAFVTPGEMLAGAVVLWVAGWSLLAFKRPLRHAGPMLLLAVVVAVLGYGRAQEYRRPLALVRHSTTTLRAAPFPSAKARRAMNAGTTVEVVRRYAGWVLVRRGNDQGWLQATEIVSLTGRAG